MYAKALLLMHVTLLHLLFPDLSCIILVKVLISSKQLADCQMHGMFIVKVYLLQC